jgi:hypothetical protein
MKTTTMKNSGLALCALAALAAAGCASDTKMKNKAKESAARFWQDKAYPGKSFDVQVIEAEKTDDGTYRVKGIVDGETRVGNFSPNTETFSEGYYSLAHERNRRIAELEQELKYWKEKSEGLEKEIYKIKVQLKLARGGKLDDDSPEGEGGAKRKKASTEGKSED